MSQDKAPSRVVGGLKATVNNPRMSDETKSNAKERIQEIQGESGSAAAQGKDDQDALDSEEYQPEAPSATGGSGTKHNQVMGGYKATLKNPNVSDEAKEHAEQVLKDNDAL